MLVVGSTRLRPARGRGRNRPGRRRSTSASSGLSLLRRRHRLGRRARRRSRRSRDRLKALHQPGPERLVVVDDQQRARLGHAAAVARSLHRAARGRSRVTVVPAPLAMDKRAAAALGEDPGQEQAESEAAPGAAGREERLAGARQHLGGHARAAIADVDANAGAVGGVRCAATSTAVPAGLASRALRAARAPPGGNAARDVRDRRRARAPHRPRTRCAGVRPAVREPPRQSCLGDVDGLRAPARCCRRPPAHLIEDASAAIHLGADQPRVVGRSAGRGVARGRPLLQLTRRHGDGGQRRRESWAAPAASVVSDTSRSDRVARAPHRLERIRRLRRRSTRRAPPSRRHGHPHREEVRWESR